MEFLPVKLKCILSMGSKEERKKLSLFLLLALTRKVFKTSHCNEPPTHTLSLSLEVSLVSSRNSVVRMWQSLVLGDTWR